MKFTDFVRKNQNVITGTRSARITESIPISKDREKFYTDKQFHKYDVVVSDGKKLRILEKCSNYYACVNESGNIVRKFANALTLTEDTTPMWRQLPLMLHGYTPSEAFQESDQCAKFMTKLYQMDEQSDDIALLKELKEADKKVLEESMETDYKLRDKLTIAKLIADAVGIPHDPLSTPENLVNAAIRKAKKDPQLMRNKAVLANMLTIAKSVGIRFSDTTFEVPAEVDEEVLNELSGPDSKDSLDAERRKYSPEGVKKNREELNKKLKQVTPEMRKKLHLPDEVKEDVLNEDPLNAWKNRMKAAGAVHYISGKHVSGTTASKLHAYKIVDGKKVKVGAFDQVGRRGIAEDTDSFKSVHDKEVESNASEHGKPKHITHKYDSMSDSHTSTLHYDHSTVKINTQKYGNKYGHNVSVMKHAVKEGINEDRVELRKYHHRMHREALASGNHALAKHHLEVARSLREDTLDELKTKTLNSYIKGALNNPWDKKDNEKFPSSDKKVTRDKGLQRHKGVNRALDRLVKEDTLEELNIDTVKSYSEKAKTAPAKSLDKVIKRFGGQERAQDRIHKDALKKMTDRLKESEEVDEGTVTKIAGGIRHTGTKGYGNDPEKEESDYLNKSRQGSADKNMEIYHKKAKPTKTGVGSVHQNEEVEPLTLKSLRKKLEMDVPAPDENNYAAKNKEMMGGEPTDDTPDMPDDNTGMTPDAISFRDIVKKLNAVMVPKSEVSTATDKLPHGNALNPTSDTNRKQLIRKLQGN